MTKSTPVKKPKAKKVEASNDLFVRPTVETMAIFNMLTKYWGLTKTAAFARAVEIARQNPGEGAKPAPKRELNAIERAREEARKR